MSVRYLSAKLVNLFRVRNCMSLVIPYEHKHHRIPSDLLGNICENYKNPCHCDEVRKTEN